MWFKTKDVKHNANVWINLDGILFVRQVDDKLVNLIYDDELIQIPLKDWVGVIDGEGF